MITILLSWICLGTSSLLWGFQVQKLLDRIEPNNRKHMATYVISGLCALTVYAQFFSVFYKVGMVALSLVLLADVIIAVTSRKQIFRLICGMKPFLGPKMIVSALSCILMAILSTGFIKNGDTYLYHAQAIRWIEEYGIVKGLGNIHSRFAFNSSFLCLQALFSFKGFTSHSLHSVNGFVAWLFFSYSMCTFKSIKKRRLYASDFLRICMVVLLSHNINEFSSPGTDFFAHTLSVYIVCEGVSLVEEQEKAVAPYAFLSVISVFAFTLKLSAALIMLLAIRPVCMLVREKRGREIALYLLAGFLVAAPYLVRNVIISGYLIYPFEKIDIFNVDWKMPVEVVEYERLRTASWAREIFGVLRLDSPISEWFPYWLEKQDNVLLTYLILDIISCIIILSDGVIAAIKKKDYDYLFVGGVLIICLIYWFLSAPNIRFGRPYILMPIFLATGLMIRRINIEKSFVLSLIFLVFLAKPLTGFVKETVNSEFWPIYCADYETHDAEKMEFNGISFYVTPEGNAGYYLFPAVLYADSLDNIEMRGDNISDGFRYVVE